MLIYPTQGLLSSRRSRGEV